MIYCENYKVRYSETGENLKATLPAVMAYLQDASINHSAGAGRGVKKLSEMHLAWILAGWHVKIERFPSIGEKLTAKTWASGFKNMYGYRNFHLTDEEESIIAKASSVWILYDYGNLKFHKVSDEDIKGFDIEDICIFDDDTVYKIKKSDKYNFKSEITVSKTDIDTNGHVNNIAYISYIVNAFPEMNFTEFRIQYKAQARFGDTIHISYNFDDATKKIILTNPDGDIYALADIIR